jgi:cell division protein DivIC
MKKLPAFTKNFYFIVGSLFFIWILFIDNNDLVTQFQLQSKLHNLEDEREYYLDKIEDVNKERQELMSNDELLEKFAREKYLMKKESEDLYILVEE